MQRRISSFALLTVVAAAAVAVVVWYRASSPVAIPAAQAPAPAPVPRELAAAPSQVSAAPASPTPTAESVSQWIAETQSSDAAKRATAITALGTAPKRAAVPVLRRLLTDAEPQVDRPLALQSLRDLALNQGDADGTIREAVRNAIYHGDDQTKADDVQDVLDIIEESEQH